MVMWFTHGVTACRVRGSLAVRAHRLLGTAHRVRVRRRSLGVAAALTVAVTTAWIVLSPLAALTVLLLFIAVAAALGLGGSAGLAEYIAASDRAKTAEPPWWPEFEFEFRRECRRHERAMRRSSHS